MSGPLTEDERREVRAVMHEAAEALRTANHEARGHNLVDPRDCRMCRNDALADRLERAVETLSRGTLNL